jgi:hypothetical protein
MSSLVKPEKRRTMIIPQNYELYVVHVHPGGKPKTEPVIAWRIVDGDVTQHPVPITPQCGELTDDHGGYLVGAAAAAEFRQGLDRAMRDGDGPRAVF